MADAITGPSDSLWQQGVSTDGNYQQPSPGSEPNEYLEAGWHNIMQDSDKLQENDAYYEGTKRLQHLGIAIPPQLRQLQVVIDWPAVLVDGLEERLDLEGFRVPDDDDLAAELWGMWQFNNLDEESQLLHVDTFALGSAYTIVGTNEDDTANPIISVESAKYVYANRNVRTRRIDWAVHFVEVKDGRPIYAVLYLPDETSHHEFLTTLGRWVEIEEMRDTHRLGEVPVTPYLNRSRASDTRGRSEMNRIKVIADECSRTLTEMALAREFHAVPQRYLLGVAQEDFKHKDGSGKTNWEVYIGNYVMLGDENAKAGQFNASDLRNFHETVALYSKLASAATGFPASYFGFSTQNPASADAIRADESRLIKRAERKQRPLSGSHERTMRLAWRFAHEGAEVPDELKRMVTLWRDPGTYTLAAKADAAVKLYGNGTTGIIDREVAWDMLGLSEDQKDGMRARGLIDSQLGSLLSTPDGTDVPVDAQPDTGGSAADDMRAKFDALGVAIRAGVEPDSAAAQLGLEGLQFTGAVPTSLRLPEEDASSLEQV